ncbi:hypothetical protein JHK85_026187 [Glycine max]|nr:hypothetical protein JHK85_026187 [Glycine max]
MPLSSVITPEITQGAEKTSSQHDLAQLKWHSFTIKCNVWHELGPGLLHVSDLAKTLRMVGVVRGFRDAYGKVLLRENNATHMASTPN